MDFLEIFYILLYKLAEWLDRPFVAFVRTLREELGVSQAWAVWADVFFVSMLLSTVVTIVYATRPGAGLRRVSPTYIAVALLTIPSWLVVLLLPVPAAVKIAVTLAFLALISRLHEFWLGVFVGTTATVASACLWFLSLTAAPGTLPVNL